MNLFLFIREGGGVVVGGVGSMCLWVGEICVHLYRLVQCSGIVGL